jgi:hypothetical protein
MPAMAAGSDWRDSPYRMPFPVPTLLIDMMQQ